MLQDIWLIIGDLVPEITFALTTQKLNCLNDVIPDSMIDKGNFEKIYNVK